MHVEIREFQASDLSLLKGLIHKTIDISYAEVYPVRARDYFKSFHSEEQIVERSREGTILMVEAHGRVVATGSIVGQDIFGLFVKPGLQGQGVGRQLMEALELKAMNSGCELAELSVSLPSKPFYENLGYTMLESCSIDVGGGETLDYWKAEKIL